MSPLLKVSKETKRKTKNTITLAERELGCAEVSQSSPITAGS
jgi:hypothetical protein